MKLKHLAFFFIAATSLYACKKDQTMAKSPKGKELMTVSPDPSDGPTPIDTTGITGGEDKPKPTHP